MLGDTDLAFLISSGIMLVLFIPIYYKLCRKPRISRGHKIVYAIIFLSLIILGGLSIFVFRFFMDWREVIMFNSIMVLISVFMLQDLAGIRFAQKFPFGKLLLAITFTILFVVCSAFVFIDLINFLALGEWINILPLPMFVVLTIVSVLIFILAARFYGKGEEEFTGRAITSGGVTLLYIIVFAYGMALIVFGSPLHGTDYWIPPHIQVGLLILGIILLSLTIPLLYRERQKRVKAGWGR